MLIDLHNHTLPRSSDSSLKPEALARAARERGLDGVCLTEHDAAWDSREMERIGGDYGLLVLAGIEVTTDRGHILAFGITEYKYEMSRAERLREIVQAEGGVMVLAHPYRGSLYSAYGPLATTRLNGAPWAGHDETYRRLVDAVEALNGTGTPAQNSFSLEVCQRLGMPGTGGSDAHTLSEVAKCATDFRKEIGQLPELIAALKAGDVRAVDLRVRVRIDALNESREGGA